MSRTDQRHRTTKRVTLVGAGVNAALACLQILFGIVGKSQALLADGIHTLADLASDLVVLIAANKAAQSADRTHPYGHGRIETLASLFLGALLVAVGAGIGLRGFDSIFKQTASQPEATTLVFAALAIVAKEGLYRYTLRAARSIHSSLLESNAWHHRSDALSSLIVVSGISAQLLGIPYMDAAAAIIVALMIIYIGYRLGRRALDELIDTSLDLELVEKIRQTMRDHESVTDVHNLRSRSMAGQGFIDAHIEVDPRLTVSEAHFIAHRLERLVKRQFPQVIDLQLHIDPLIDDLKDSQIARLPERSEIEAALEQAWQELPIKQQILQLKLHYLEKTIEVDVILPAIDYSPAQREEIELLRSRALSVDSIGPLNLYYLEQKAPN